MDHAYDIAATITAADAVELAHVTTATRGQVVDAGADTLPAAFKEIRGCH